jgi:hypothetical protein
LRAHSLARKAQRTETGQRSSGISPVRAGATGLPANALLFVDMGRIGSRYIGQREWRRNRLLPLGPLFIAMATAAIGCGAETMDLEIASYQEPCVGLFPQFCLVLEHGTDKPPEWHHGGIEGFEPAWGTRYRIRVEVRHIANPPADAPSIELKLMKVLGQQVEPAGTEFSVRVISAVAELLVDEPGTGLRLQGQRTIACESEQACTDARAWLGAPNTTLVLRLQHPASVTEPLRLVGTSS